MNRYYGMALTVRGIDPKKCRQVQKAAREEWPGFDDWHVQHLEGATILTASGEGSLCGGESEEDFADRLAHAVWAAHGTCCEVEVAATYLEEQPYEAHIRGEACFAEFIRSKPRAKKTINRKEEPCASAAEPYTKP